MAWAIEVTDTFGGEANYSWVRRYTMDSRVGEPQRELVRRAKALAGWTGMRCAVDAYGDAYAIRPVGRSAPCWVAFVNWTDDAAPAADDDAQGEV